MVSADNIGRYADLHWNGCYASDTNSTVILLTTMLFSVQIVCDFAGYSSIAHRLAYLLGIQFPVNLNNRYLAASFNEFWQQWHITL